MKNKLPMSGDSVKQQFKEMAALGAASVQRVYRDGEDKPLAAVIFVRGEETQAFLDAIKKVEDSWQK